MHQLNPVDRIAVLELEKALKGQCRSFLNLLFWIYFSRTENRKMFDVFIFRSWPQRIIIPYLLT